MKVKQDVRFLQSDDEFCGTPALSAMAAQPVIEITPEMLAARLSRRDDFELIDVREPHETAVDGIPGARLIPLGTIGEVILTLDRTRDIVVYCRSGKRSADAVRQLQAAGFDRVTSLAGGMLQWSAHSQP